MNELRSDRRAGPDILGAATPGAIQPTIINTKSSRCHFCLINETWDCSVFSLVVRVHWYLSLTAALLHGTCAPIAAICNFSPLKNCTPSNLTLTMHVNAEICVLDGASVHIEHFRIPRERLAVKGYIGGVLTFDGLVSDQPTNGGRVFQARLSLVGIGHGPVKRMFPPRLFHMAWNNYILELRPWNVALGGVSQRPPL
ncbi:hypothetical protein CBL_10753 [Carabus blaptoides fortunei]